MEVKPGGARWIDFTKNQIEGQEPSLQEALMKRRPAQEQPVVDGSMPVPQGFAGTADPHSPIFDAVHEGYEKHPEYVNSAVDNLSNPIYPQEVNLFDAMHAAIPAQYEGKNSPNRYKAVGLPPGRNPLTDIVGTEDQ
jgi:hypothetical protein